MMRRKVKKKRKETKEKRKAKNDLIY